MLETATEGGERRERLKSLNLWQKKRRLRALEDVKKLRSEAREAELALRRRSGSQGVNTTTESVDTSSSSSSSSGGGAGAGGDFRDDSRPGFIRAKETRKRYASQLSVLEWLIDVPEDLHTSWYVMPRPEGPRCLVISENGSTVSRTKNGSFHKEFQSTLPNGSRESSRASCKGSKCVLDAVFHSPSNTFFVTDCMVWEDYSLTNCDFEFRRFWVSQKLSESGGQQVHQASKFKVEIIPMEVATQQMLVNAYSNEFPYTKDGLILIHKDCLYAEGQTPLCLQWKDESCSRYPIDTDANGNVLEKQSVVLQLGEDQRTLCTGDCPPIALGALPQDFVEQNSGLLNSGTLFRCNIGARGFDFAPDGRPVGAHLELVGVSRKRVAGEIVSRILFQYLTRTRQITFQSLLGGGMNG